MQDEEYKSLHSCLCSNSLFFGICVIVCLIRIWILVKKLNFFIGLISFLWLQTLNLLILRTLNYSIFIRIQVCIILVFILPISKHLLLLVTLRCLHYYLSALQPQFWSIQLHPKTLLCLDSRCPENEFYFIFHSSLSYICICTFHSQFI